MTEGRLDSTPAEVPPPDEIPVVRRTPVLFGEAPHRSVGWLHGERGQVGVVICAPLGAEEECTHRSLLHLADGLAQRSMVALRFDYPGTGDSEGDSPSDMCLADWVEAVERAADFLRREAGCTQVALVGLRLGAALAGMAAARARATWIALWAPVSSGRAYSRELRAVAALGAGHALAEVEIDVAGHRLTTEFLEEVAALRAQAWDLRGMQGALLLERDDAVPDEKLRETLRASGVQLDLLAFDGYAAMLDRPHDAEVPAHAVAGLCDWLAVRARAPRAAEIVEQPGRPERRLGDSGVGLSTVDYVERRLLLGPVPRFAGVLCEPPGPRAGAPIVVLLNAGSVHHVGPGRLYTRLARELAREGVPSLRVDLSMLGDSIVAGVAEENDCYGTASQRDVGELLSDLRERLGFRDVILAGLCSGAYWALQAAMNPSCKGLRAVAMINPLVIGHRPQGGRSAGLEAAEALRYRQSMRSWTKWKKVLTLRAHPRAAMAALARRAVSVASAALRDAGRRWGLGAAGAVELGLRRLRDEGVVIGMLVGSTEPGYALLRQESPREVAAGLRASTLRTFVLADCDHTFTTEPAKQQLFRVFCSFVADLREP